MSTQKVQCEKLFLVFPAVPPINAPAVPPPKIFPKLAAINSPVVQGYSILEIADSHASDDYFLRRESYWKDVLLSRKFGLNGN